ncbi:hypothetical protein SH611_19205 [Geminicoccaceae bacterium 1502E]|nr:hypothetical protein [Geminicoccaceae bacterium 1502E]
MPTREHKINRTLHCVEITSGEDHTGILSLTETRIRTTLYSYRVPVYLPPERAIFLITEENDVVSLYNNVALATSSCSRQVEGWRSIYQQEIGSNIAVVGRDRWLPNDPVKRVLFFIPSSSRVLVRQAFVDKVKLASSPRHIPIYETAAPNMILRGFAIPHYSMLMHHAIDYDIAFEIEFEQAKRITDYLDHVSCFTHLFSFSIGSCLSPSLLYVSREPCKNVNARKFSSDNHQCFYTRLDDRRLDAAPHDHESVITVLDDKDLSGFQECALAWIRRYDLWRNAYALMAASLLMNRQLSPERLLAACRWFEEIPVEDSRPSISTQHISVIASAAITKARELGYSLEIGNRIEGSLRHIRTESHRERFSRLLNAIATRFGAEIIRPSMLEDLCRAVRLRGKVAHGHFSLGGEADALELYRATLAMEALCFMLTAHDLPLSETNIRNMKSSRILIDYHYTAGP